MEWFVEKHDGTGFMIEGRKIDEREGVQKIEIFDTSMGKMLVIDDKIQFTEKDEAFYHEMLVHVPMLIHPSPRRVLIIGGGDGGAAREVLKHNPEEIKVVEIDRNVVEMCRKHMGIDRGAMDNEKVKIIYEDGMEFVGGCEEKFDVIIVDGSDPDAKSKSLVSRNFYSKCSHICDIFVTQSQSPVFQQEYFEAILKNSSSFPHRKIYLSFIPSYPSGMWSFLIASNKKMEWNREEIKRRYEERKLKTLHYAPSLHFASFILPKWLEEIARRNGMEIEEF